MIARLANSTLAACIGLSLFLACLNAPAAQASFGLEKFDVTYTNADGTPATQAGSHPFQMTTSVYFNRLDPQTPTKNSRTGPSNRSPA